MTDMREGLAFTLWKNDAARVAPNVARNRNPDAFLAEADATRNHWLHHADAVIATLPLMVEQLEWVDVYRNGCRFETSWGIPPICLVEDGTFYWKGGNYKYAEDAMVPANVMHRAQIMDAFGLPKQEAQND